MSERLVARDPAEHAMLAAELLARGIAEAVADRGVARVALSGGTTPSPAYQRLGALWLPFDRVDWFWVDERAVRPDSPRSNYGMAARALNLDGGSRGRVHRMVGEGDLADQARSYEELLRQTFGIAAAVAFDAMVLGIGEDGHTASLFPGTGAAAIADRLVAAIGPQHDRGIEGRLTLTAPVILEARFAVVLARGASKRDAVSAALSSGSEDEVPARILRRAKGRVVWVLDREATPSD